jgi:hypothetical protein
VQSQRGARPAGALRTVDGRRPTADGVNGVYYMVYMATRTQIYLTDEQRARLAERARATGVPMSQLIREAVDALLSTGDDLETTFGSVPGLGDRVPSREEWDRRG